MEEARSSIVLLMTATIAPKDCPDAQFDSDERRRRYLRAFEFYVRRLNSKMYSGIVFAENSDANLDDFAAVVPQEYSKAVEFVSAPSGIFPKNLQKNNEFVLIDYAIDHSRLLKESVMGFFKVTGRYYFRNISSLLKDVLQRGSGLRLYCDQRDHRLYSKLGLKKKEQDGETRFFFCSVQFWRENFYGYFKRNPKWRRVEDIMFEVAVRHYGDNDCCFRYPHQPLLGGHQYSSKQGVDIVCMGVHFNPRVYFAFYYVRWFFESLIRRVFPRFWF